MAILSDTDRYFAGCHTVYSILRGGMTTATRPITISNANQCRPAAGWGWCAEYTVFYFPYTREKAFIVPDYMPESEALAVYSPGTCPLLIQYSSSR